MPSMRKAKKSDVTRIWDIRTQAILKVCATHYTDDAISAWANSPMPECFDEILLSFGAIVLEDQGDLVGFGFVDAGNSALESIFVDPRSIGRGYGKQIADELQSIAKKAGVQILKLSSSLNAVEFYKSIGFKAGKETFWEHPSGCSLGCVPMTKAI
jgi:GNAT superfamily N-acetyltransferase